MVKPSLERIFRYVPNTLDLINFPDSRLYNSLRHSLGAEPVLKRHQRKTSWRRNAVDPSFSIRYIEERQDFFQRLPDGYSPVRKRTFDKEFPKIEDLEERGNQEWFLRF